MTVHLFGAKLARSTSPEKHAMAKATLMAMVPGAERVVVVDDRAAQHAGVDYIVSLRGGGHLRVDVKWRNPGCRQYWQDGEPELAIETVGTHRNGSDLDRGWLRKPASQTDAVLYLFEDPADSDKAFLLPFKHLRMAFDANAALWELLYDEKGQTSDCWESRSLFVPASAVLAAVDAISRGRAQRGDDAFADVPF